MRTTIILLSILLALLPVSPAVYAAWGDFFKSLIEETTSDQDIGNLSNSEIIAGLKEALDQGSRAAIQKLGRVDGFYRNPSVRIPMPESLETVESTLRTLKQDEIADEFVLTLNRAAEKAIPETVDVFGAAIRKMSFADARSVLRGPDDAATQYFRRTSSPDLEQRILPIVRRATDSVGVTSTYKAMVDQLGVMSSLVDTSSLDIDRYVTDKAVEGLFTMLAREEKLIREDPAARTTTLLKRVFSQ